MRKCVRICSKSEEKNGDEGGTIRVLVVPRHNVG